jgi:hypothetical protein
MVGDAERLRRTAGWARATADTARLAAFRVRVTGTLRWESPAAALYRQRVEERAAALEQLSASMHATADALERHAAEVERVSDALVVGVAVARRVGMLP